MIPSYGVPYSEGFAVLCKDCGLRPGVHQRVDYAGVSRGGSWLFPTDQELYVPVLLCSECLQHRITAHHADKKAEGCLVAALIITAIAICKFVL